MPSPYAVRSCIDQHAVAAAIVPVDGRWPLAAGRRHPRQRPVNLSVYNSGVLATASPEGALNRQTARDFRSYERTAGVTPPKRAGASTDAAVVTPAGS